MKYAYTYGHLLDRAVKAIRLDLLKRFQKLGLNITPDQWFILELLFENESGLTQNEIAKMTDKDAPTVSRIIDLLCKKDFVKRSPFEGDKRKHKIQIKQYGKDLVQKARMEIDLSYDQGWDALNEDDLNHLNRITTRIVTNYSRQTTT